MSVTPRTWTTLAGLTRLAVAGGLIALAAGAMPGCVIAVGGTKRVVVAEPPVEQGKLDQIRLGQTTEEQARDLLGAPTTRFMRDDGVQVWTYKGRPASGKTVVYLDEDDDEIETDQVYTGKVTVELKNGVVTAVRKD